MAIDDPYITVDAFKKRANIVKADRDEYIGNAIKSASRVLEAWTEVIFNQSTPGTARYFTAYSRGELLVGPFVTIDAIDVDLGDALFSEAWDLDRDVYFAPRNAPADGKPYTTIVTKPGGSFGFPCADRSYTTEDAVRVTGTWGYAAIPDNIKEATYLLAHRYFERWSSPFGIVGTAQLGSTDSINVLVGRDRDIRELVMTLRTREVSF